MEVATRQEELVYWYTGFEDPNCIAVVELVATVMDTRNNIQVGVVLSQRWPSSTSSSIISSSDTLSNEGIVSHAAEGTI